MESPLADDDDNDDLSDDTATLLSMLPGASVVVDEHDEVVRCNPAAYRLGVVSDDAIAQQQVLDAMSEETLTGKILGMREPYRTPCRLMLLEGRTAAEAAALCGRPQKTVEAQIYRAKKMLAEQIRQERRSEDGIVS